LSFAAISVVDPTTRQPRSPLTSAEALAIAVKADRTASFGALDARLSRSDAVFSEVYRSSASRKSVFLSVKAL
jgi:hypothetical protein